MADCKVTLSNGKISIPYTNKANCSVVFTAAKSASTTSTTTESNS